MKNRHPGLSLPGLTLIALALCAPGLVQAATCTISPQNPSIKPGQSITWKYSSSGFSRTPTPAWTFGGGTPSSSTKTSLSVSYASAGKFVTNLTLTAGTTTAKCTANVIVDASPPSVSLSSSAAGPFSPPGTLVINATASDNVAVTKVEFYDGTTLKATDTTTPYSYSWSFTAADARLHTWKAKAYDAAGNVGNSNVVQLEVLAPVPAISINSTSQDSVGQNLTVVPEQPRVIGSDYSVLAINDLGMHCGDLDTRIASILPPFQVLLSQVIQKGATSKPVLNPTGVTLTYSAVSNPADPILANLAIDGLKSDGSTYKTNFWDTVTKGAYDPFYPGGMGITPLWTGPFPTTDDVGLPVPNVEEYYIGADGLVDQCKVTSSTGSSCDGILTAVQHVMPGLRYPYDSIHGNAPQVVEEAYGDKPFFLNFPFGYVAQGVNWYEGAGLPFAAFDDFGRENPYPLVRVQAQDASGNTLSTVDTVLPISGEASCSNCHADPKDVQGNRSRAPTDALLAVYLPVVTSIEDPDDTMPSRVSVEYASDINILRLHDLKHGANYVKTTCNAGNCVADPKKMDPCTINAASPNGTLSCLTNKALVQGKPVVCQVCHYTPALDLAQLGPLAGEPGTLANGRNQLAHKSNSNVMHSHHGGLDAAGKLPGEAGYAPANLLFTPIAAPQQNADGSIANQAERLTALENSCYQCHPGKNTKCLRGAMFNGGMLCSDCHGTMAQVGNDFSRNVSPSTAGAFQLAKDFYSNPATLRVPWANEPGCGSCHTGDASSNLAGTTGALVNTKDGFGNSDGLRLLQAFRTGDAKATPIIPTNKRFAEPLVPAAFNGFANPGAGNPQLYRVSTGHGGVMCEGCHGATHAEWPNANPNANDNLTAKQLQGHTGAIIECTTCHTTSALPANTQGGPHGMHLVNDSRFWKEAHKDAAKAENVKPNRGSCGACHGADHQGTVLSRAPVARTWVVESINRTVGAGQPVPCDLCHSLSKSFGT